VLFLSNILKIKGLRVRIAGKLNGKMRRSKYSYQLGKVELQSLVCYLTYSISLSYTKFGVIATKV
jgi:ribosomal protein S3